MVDGVLQHTARIKSKCDMSHQTSPGVLGVGSHSVMLKRVDKNPIPSIRDLYPQLTETELAEAEDNLDRYLALALRIFERIESQTYPQADPLAPNKGTLY